MFLIFEEWSLAKKWISPKFQSRVWSSSSRGGHQARPEEEAATRAYIVTEREPKPTPPPPLPYARIPGSPSVITHDKMLRKTQTEAQRLPPCQTASRPHRLPASARKERQASTNDREEPSPAVSPRKVELGRPHSLGSWDGGVVVGGKE